MVTYNFGGEVSTLESRLMAISFLKVKKFLFRHSWVTGLHSSSTWLMLGIRKSVKLILKNGSKSNL
jgi:hypothetical protein